MLGEKLGVLLLVEVIFAVFVCALAVHAAAVRLMFAMARDNNLPFADVAFARLAAQPGAVVPSLVVGVPGRGDPDREHQPAQRDRDALLGRHRLGQSGVPAGDDSTLAVAAKAARRLLRARPIRSEQFVTERTAVAAAPAARYFSLGRLGLPVNVVAVVWGLFVVTNISWPRAEIYGDASLGPLRGAPRDALLVDRAVRRIMFSISESAPASCAVHAAAEIS